MSLAKALEHIEFHHQSADGYIALAKKREDGHFDQYHYRAEEVSSKLSEWLGEDVYFSQNTFYKPSRRVENVRQLRALYVDVDCYLLNYTPDWVIGKMELELFGESVPEPNLIIYSGRGFVVVWLLNPIPAKALPLWQSVERHFASQFSFVGADSKATDASRILRVAGTVNSKSGAEVTVQYRHAHRYELRQLQHDYLPEITKKSKGRPRKIVQLFNIHKLYHARLLDLVKLLELRQNDLNQCRELFCFLYRYWSCCFLNDESEALQKVLELNSSFVRPLSEREVVRATQSAERAYHLKNDKKANELAIERGYPGAGYNVRNETIIEWLAITPEEQQHLSTIISKKEKQRRNTLYQRKKRRELGTVERKVYLTEQQERTNDKLQQLREALAANPKATQRELAQMLEVTTRYIRKLLAKL
ncbi:replication protein [Paenibacillus alvei]|uniref:Replication protein n=1 Tax=Paenibacillus alvei TaxID=44250 RepID=A0ABT4H181_PAEAL|nr:hypothetical protein [Paenibacillus alvei]EJW13753.1 replication protein Rep [Paenibacillus alvei DSM 29]MCY9540754.1 replication protein [Paenibacillus alvei]MCY9702611.1 replication protein [Paenibacillus alvei]MCY9732137.1 replication protein [Paenibacillus alvei]MCY9752759.1 replication protein [Paenibacillus alvei]